MLHFNAVGLQHCRRKVFGVEGDDSIGVTNNRCGYHVAVVGVGEFDGVGQSFIICYQTVWHAGVHPLNDQRQFANEFWPVFDQVARPLVMNRGGPARVVKALNGQTQKGVTDQLGIQDIGIQNCRVTRRARHLKLQPQFF